MMPPKFHLAFPVKDLNETRKFYVESLGCRIGRESDHWIDFDFFGHQISAHLVQIKSGPEATSEVDGKQVPVRHFGAILEWDAWHKLAKQLEASGVNFLIPPYIRFKGQDGEQATMFITDPSGNCLEFKSFKNAKKVFAK